MGPSYLSSQRCDGKNGGKERYWEQFLLLCQVEAMAFLNI